MEYYMQSIVKIKPNFEFTEEHRETAEMFLRKEAFPQFYTNCEFTSLKYKGTFLIPSDAILRDGHGSSQSVRYDGLNHKYKELKQDINENGYQLYQRPISVTKNSEGRYVFVDGRTKDKILNERKVKNRIVNLYEICESEIEDLGERMNSGEDSPPAGLIKEADIVSLAHKKIDKGQLELDVDSILEWINKCCGKGRFSAQKRSDLAYQIFHQENAIQNSKLLPRNWANVGEVLAWLKEYNYVDNSKVVYLPFSSTSPKKAIFAAASLLQQNTGKEVRVVIYVSKYKGYDLKDCYINAVLKFKKSWYEDLSKVGKGFFDDSTGPLDDKIKLYGAVPARIEDICPDDTKMIIFGKNDQKINENYLSTKSLNSLFDIQDEEDEEELAA
jgi:hypothetical protein